MYYDTACPECKGLNHFEARRCRFCSTKFEIWEPPPKSQAEIEAERLANIASHQKYYSEKKGDAIWFCFWSVIASGGWGLIVAIVQYVISVILPIGSSSVLPIWALGPIATLMVGANYISHEDWWLGSDGPPHLWQVPPVVAIIGAPLGGLIGLFIY